MSNKASLLNQAAKEKILLTLARAEVQENEANSALAINTPLADSALRSAIFSRLATIILSQNPRAEQIPTLDITSSEGPTTALATRNAQQQQAPSLLEAFISTGLSAAQYSLLCSLLSVTDHNDANCAPQPEKNPRIEELD